MTNRESITSGQMSLLFFTFMTGSAIVNIPAPIIAFAKNDAWLSLIISCTIGGLLLSCILYLNKHYPGLTFVEYSLKAVGTWITFLLLIPFVAYLFHMCAGIVLDVDLFMTSSLMDETPMYIFSIVVLLAAAITAHVGIEAMARMFIIIITLMLCFVVVIFIVALPDYRPEQLLPILSQGIKPVLHGAYFTYGFPYAEVIVFAMLLAFVRKTNNNELNRSMYMALIINGVILITSVVCTIMMFGPMAGERKYSLYQFARIIQVVDIIERIESVIAMALIAGSYMKATITLYALTLAISQLLRLRDYRILIFPTALIIVLLTLLLSEGMTKWEESVASIHPLYVSISYVLPLLVLTLVTWIKSKRKQSSV
ncbi:endospore germination permease [Paenibacillus sp. LHD-38]|uniref:GerAB/ArcD/ProY family transporter n=1 Tax=Paenibacillus sp. LHD-38 TaxID=3072143 RepID=UPI00280D0A07|nr:endospore germination permease [Paenibacillus sp. LHD-38]MDQ8739474.1 endospore germination permease [Paenibacillus sp. LHD-38]